MSKKLIRVFFAIFIAAFVLICSGAGICYALDVGNENIQINLHPVFIDNSGVHFQYNMDVDVLITDPAGKKYGYDPIAHVEYNEFPGTSGQTSNDDKFFSMEYMFNLINGTYTLEVWSDNLTEFLMEAYVSRRASRSASLKTSGIIDKGFKSKFEFTYTSDPAQPASTAIMRLSSPASLKQDIQVSRKLQLIDNDGIMKSLLAKADAIDAAISRGNKTAAKNQLDAFLGEVAAQKGKHLTDEAAKILTEDAEYLITTLK